jgi:membrane protease YdiL (CAAX protease family)
MGGQTATIVLLGWFLAFLMSGTFLTLVLKGLPFLRPFALPIAYGFHAFLGLTFLCRVEGISVRELWRRLAPKGSGPRSLAWALGFISMAVLAAVLVALVLSPLMKQAEPPQKELTDLIAGASGSWRLLPILFAVTILAPFFEEVLFRGFLMTCLGQHLTQRFGLRLGTALALVLASLCFGAIHFQLTGLPILSVLGLVLGLAFLRTGSLWTSILVHGTWNTGVFALMILMTS